MVDYFMRIMSVKSTVRKQRVGIECRSRIDVLLHFALQRVLASIRNYHSADLPPAFEESHHRDLILGSGSGNTASPLCHVHVTSLAADEGFVRLDFAGKLASKEIILHNQSDAMEHEPCGLLSDFQVTRNFVTADSVLTVSDKPSSSEPLVQTDGRIFHHSSDL